jgi:hypothetical protein
VGSKLGDEALILVRLLKAEVVLPDTPVGERLFDSLPSFSLMCGALRGLNGSRTKRPGRCLPRCLCLTVRAVSAPAFN